MTMRNLVMALLVTLVLATGVTLNVYGMRRVHQLTQQLQQAQAELAQTTSQLQDANRKLAFLEASKARVQPTTPLMACVRR